MLPFGLLGLSFAEGDGAGGGGDDGENGDDSGNSDNTVSKAEFDALQAKFEQTNKDLDDMRGEVMSPDYLDYLDSKDKGIEDKNDTKSKESEISDDVFENMSKKDLYAKAKADAKAELKGDIDSIKLDNEQRRKEANRQEVARFSRTHDDYERYRPVMYGLSIDPKNSNLALQELYDKAKEYVTGMRVETTEAEKKRQTRLKGEKPGSSTASYEKNKKLSVDEATAQAASEVEDELGPIPLA